MYMHKKTALSVFQTNGRWWLLLWQVLFIACSVTWLWAPWANQALSSRTTLISQYEAFGQPYAVLLRLADILGGLLLALLAFYLHRKHKNTIITILLACVGVGMLFDPIFPTTCHSIGRECQEYLSPYSVAHAVETVITSVSLFLLMAYDAYRRKKVVSIAAVFAQVLYVVLWLTDVAGEKHFNTITQFTYQFALIIWLAWFCRDFLTGNKRFSTSRTTAAVRSGAAGWLFVNGIVATLLSLTHVYLFGINRHAYFLHSAWVAQHSIVVGVVMLYLSRHLARGEMRARQVVLWLLGFGIIKYAVVTPAPFILLAYVTGFVLLFVFRDSFTRGTVAMTWNVRLQDFATVLGGLIFTSLAALWLIDGDSHAHRIAAKGINHFHKYVFEDFPFSRHSLASAMFAHALSVFVVISVAVLLWALFRPSPKKGVAPADQSDTVQRVLKQFSRSSEDYFKWWPHDKDYFWNKHRNGFVAYRRSGSIAYVLADPVGSQPKALLRAFVDDCQAHRLKVAALPVYESRCNLYKDAGFNLIQIGGSAVIDIRTFAEKTVRNKWWRWQNNRAKRSGYMHHVSTPPHDQALLQQFQHMSDQWLDSGGHEEHGFTMGYYDDSYLQACSVHYLTGENNEVIAFVNILPQFKPGGTVTIDLLRYRPDANGAMPFLLSSIILALSENPVHTHFDLGFVPFATTSGPVMKAVKTLGSRFFSASGLEQFKNKFEPEWEPNYLAYQGDLADLAHIATRLERVMRPQPTDRETSDLPE